MTLLAFALLAQLAAPAHSRLPVLSFPEPGLDDPAAYQGYLTRFFRDAADNTLQIYLDQRTGRIVHLFADAENASIGLSARDTSGRPVAVSWGSAGATVSRAGRRRGLGYDLVAASDQVVLGGFLLGSMRVERDYQYAGRQRESFATPFVAPELRQLVDALGRLPDEERRRHLDLVGAADLGALSSRLRPALSLLSERGMRVVRVVQPSLDGRDTMTVEVHTDPRQVELRRGGDSLTLRARAGSRIPFTLVVATTGRALTPLTRQEIFTPHFLRFVDAARRAGRRGGSDAAVRARWLDRELHGMELLASREKLMAGLPTYATYFGRDMLMTALMMRPIWRAEVSEFVIASVLRKLGPEGDVSHEEAVGGQAVREAAAEYAQLLDGWEAARREGWRQAADSLLARAASVLRDRRRVRENYHMVDDEFQLPVLVGRWITDPRRSPSEKRAFLLDSSDGRGPRLILLLRELALVARLTEGYARDPRPEHLVSFVARDSGRWQPASWRDSQVGYANGRFAMDVNAIWAPHALEAIATILEALRVLGLPAESPASSDRLAALAETTPLGRYARDASALREAIRVWRGASRHFVVRLDPDEVRTRVAARLAAMPETERRYWREKVAATHADRDSLQFLALALDARGTPIAVANTDPATALFLGGPEGGAGGGGKGAGGDAAAEALSAVRLFVRPYPVGLLIDRVGPVVANDAYAPPAVWQAFARDPYHGPRVVWGREVNLLLLGIMNHLDGATPSGVRDELRRAARQVLNAVRGSGFRSELWSYAFPPGGSAPVAVRYGSGSDLQLWSISDLAVQFALSHRER